MPDIWIIDGEQVIIEGKDQEGACRISETVSGKCVGRKGCSCTTIWVHTDMTCPCDRKHKIQLEIKE